MLIIHNPGEKSFLKDSHWYIALGAGIIFWLVYGLSFNAFYIIPYDEIWRTLFFAVLLYPILEEIVFRGWIQGHVFIERFKLKKTVFGITLANILTSLLFALAHLINQHVIWAMLIFFPSLIFGYLRDRHEYLLPSIFMHGIYNFGFNFLFYASA